MPELKRESYELKLVAKKIEKRLGQLKINRMEFAELMRVQPSSITKWLSGKHNFTIETLIKIEYTIRVNLIDVDIDRKFDQLCFPPIIKKTRKQ